MVSCARAGDVEQVAFSVINFLQIGVVADRFDALLQGQHVVIAPHDDNGLVLKSLG